MTDVKCIESGQEAYFFHIFNKIFAFESKVLSIESWIMPIVSGLLDFSRLYTIDSITSGSFGGTNPNNTMSLTGLSQVDPSATDTNALINDVNGNGVFNGVDVLTTTFPGAGSTVDLDRIDVGSIFGPIADGFGSGTDYAIFTGPSGQQYILFSEDFDVSRISSGAVTLTEQGDAVSNMAIEDILCFVGGTLIETPHGKVAVEDLKVGNLVQTFEGASTRIQWLSKSFCSASDLNLNERLRPVRIRANSFADGLPNSDLFLSRQHRVMARSRIAQRICGDQDALIPAHAAIEAEGVEVVGQSGWLEGITYYHILTSRHQVLIANGMPCESLYVGDHLKKTLGNARYTEISNLVNAGSVFKGTSHEMLSNKQSKSLVSRAIQNKRSLFECDLV